MIRTRPDPCGSCRHLGREMGAGIIVDGKVVEICKAFPNGIPDEIYHGGNPHTNPYPGDNGIQFEEI